LEVVVVVAGSHNSVVEACSLAAAGAYNLVVVEACSLTAAEAYNLVVVEGNLAVVPCSLAVVGYNVADQALAVMLG